MVILFSVTIFFTIVLAFMIYTSNAHWTVKAIALAAFLLFDVMAYENYVEMLGAPIPARPEGGFGYVWHTIAESQEIVVWVLDEHRGYRLYKYDYNREDAQKLEEMRQKSLEGEGEGVFMMFGDPAGEGLQEYEGWIHKNQNRIKPPNLDDSNTNGP